MREYHSDGSDGCLVVPDFRFSRETHERTREAGALVPVFSDADLQRLPDASRRLLLLLKVLVREQLPVDHREFAGELDLCVRTLYYLREAVAQYEHRERARETSVDLLGRCGLPVGEEEAVGALHWVYHWARAIGEGMLPPSVTVLTLCAWAKRIKSGLRMERWFSPSTARDVIGWLEAEARGVEVGRMTCEGARSGMKAEGKEEWELLQSAAWARYCAQVWLIGGLRPFAGEELSVWEEVVRQQLKRVIVFYDHSRVASGEAPAVRVTLYCCCCGACGFVQSISPCYRRVQVPEGVSLPRLYGDLIRWHRSPWGGYGSIESVGWNEDVSPTDGRSLIAPAYLVRGQGLSPSVRAEVERMGAISGWSGGVWSGQERGEAIRVTFEVRQVKNILCEVAAVKLLGEAGALPAGVELWAGWRVGEGPCGNGAA